MPFVWVTNKELSERFTHLERSVEEGRKLQDALAERWKRVELEWTEWFDKYRLLYARLAKRVRDSDAQDAPGSTNDDQPVSQHPPGPLIENRRRLRGF